MVGCAGDLGEEKEEGEKAGKEGYREPCAVSGREGEKDGGEGEECGKSKVEI